MSHCLADLNTKSSCTFKTHSHVVLTSTDRKCYIDCTLMTIFIFFNVVPVSLYLSVALPRYILQSIACDWGADQGFQYFISEC
jgi:hypothetical protein